MKPISLTQIQARQDQPGCYSIDAAELRPGGNALQNVFQPGDILTIKGKIAASCSLGLPFIPTIFEEQLTATTQIHSYGKLILKQGADHRVHIETTDDIEVFTDANQMAPALGLGC